MSVRFFGGEYERSYFRLSDLIEGLLCFHLSRFAMLSYGSLI